MSKHRNIRSWLQTCVSMLHGHEHINGYRSLDDFVLRHGIPMKLNGGLPPDVRPGVRGFCYYNAAKLVFKFPRRFIYCEGFAICRDYFPMLHAWCIDREGAIVDPTWEDGSEYLGIAVRLSYLRRRLKAQRVKNSKQTKYGLIDYWEDHWPMLRDPANTWRHPIMNTLK